MEQQQVCPKMKAEQAYAHEVKRLGTYMAQFLITYIVLCGSN